MILTPFAHDELLYVERTRLLDPTDPGDFVRIEKALAAVLKQKATPAQVEALEGLALLLEVPPLEDAAISEFVAAVGSEIRAMAGPTAEAVAPTVGRSAKSIYQRTRNAVRRQFEGQKVTAGILGTVFEAVDYEAVGWLTKQHTFFVRNTLGGIADQASKRTRNIVAAGIKQGFGRAEIAKKLEDLVLGTLKRKGYMETLAAVFANRSRTWSQLNSYSQAQVSLFRFEAVLDERTTETCRWLHGKIFRVEEGRTRMREAATLPDPEDIKFTMPFIREFKGKEGEKLLGILSGSGELRTLAEVKQSAVGEKDKVGEFDQKVSDQTLESLGVGAPPSHFRCRSDTVPVF